MKSATLAIALLMSGAALAQTYPATTQPDPAMTEPATTTTTTMTAQTDPAAPATSQIVQPSNAAPERDARGIPVISDPAVAPAGFNQPPVTTTTGVGGPLVDVSASLATQPATESYPACSRTVTDNCVQAYERGRSPQ